MTCLIFKLNYSQFLIILITIVKIANTSNVFRAQQDSSFQSQPRTNNNNNEQQIKQLQQQQQQSIQSLSSKPVYDTLLSIDERLRLLEAYDNTYKLTRLDFTLEQLTQRINSIESKLSRIENSLDTKLMKIEDLVVKRDRNEEFKTRKFDDFIERIESKYTQFEAKFDTKVDKIGSKLDSMDRYIHMNNEDLMEKFIKYDERHTVFESHVKSHIINIENLVKHSLDANTNIKEIVSYDFESVDKLVNSLKECHKHQNQAITRLNSAINQIQNNNNKNCDNSGHKTNGAQGLQNTITNNTTTNSRTLVNKTKQTGDTSESKVIPNGAEIYDNISSTLRELKQLGVDERLTQLDVHVDYYSRKIINTIQDIWRSSQSSESYLRQALDMANKTRAFIRHEFHRLQELIDPLTKAPDFTDILEPLEQKLYHLSTTIDDSFNALMISQNSFISSCNRIQEEEEQLYDVLDDMLVEIRNKSSLDVKTVELAIDGLTQLLNQSLSRLHTRIDTMDEQLVPKIREQLEQSLVSTNTSRAYASTAQAVDNSSGDCFLTRNQLISVCNKNDYNLNENNKNFNTNSDRMDVELNERSDENNKNFEPIYEDLTQTD